MATAITSNQDILDALGIQELLPEEQEELLLDLDELIFKGALLRIMEQMDDATKDAFDTLMAADPSEEQIQAFLAEHVPGADQAVEDTVKELTDDILAVTGASQD